MKIYIHLCHLSSNYEIIDDVILFNLLRKSTQSYIIFDLIICSVSNDDITTIKFPRTIIYDVQVIYYIRIGIRYYGVVSYSKNKIDLKNAYLSTKLNGLYSMMR